MKTLLVLAPSPALADAVRAAANPEDFRVLHRVAPEEAEPLLTHGMVQSCLLDLDLTGVQAIWFLERLRRRAPKVPLVVFSGSTEPEWEEEAYLQGVTHVLSKPVRPRLLSTLLERLGQPASESTPGSAAVPPQAPVASPSDTTSFYNLATVAGPAQVLPVLRNFSGILTHSLDAEGMLKQFLVLLRDIVGINRGAIFLRQPVTTMHAGTEAAEPRRLRPYASLGVPLSLLEHFELSLDEGVGSHVLRLGRILRRTSEETRQDLGAQREFELLGAQVAIPVFDRDTVLGVALFDGRITGEPLTNPELELIFHLLEQLGLAIRNIWLHSQLSSSHHMMAGILRELSSACIVVNRDLAILHANKAARKYFTLAEDKGLEIQFSDLPADLGTRIYQVVKTGAAAAPFRYAPEKSPGTLFSITVVPFQAATAGATASALLIAENITQSEQLRRLEVETANLRLIRSMADRLAHEIGNAMVPVGIHQQLLAEKWKDPEFRTSLGGAMGDCVKRVTRLVNQMRFLARDAVVSQKTFPIKPLIEEAYQDACKYQPVKAGSVNYHNAERPFVLNGDRDALKHALTEVMLNAVQANAKDPQVDVRFDTDANGSGVPALHIEIQDNGTGFTPEAREKVPMPFFGTRNVGLGLGLTVAQKILQVHHGKLEIVPREPGQSGVVRISLPVENTVTVQA